MSTTPRVIVVGVMAWAAFVAVLALEGVWSQLPASWLVGLGVFVNGYGAALFALDRELRRLLEGVPRWRLAAFALLASALAVATLVEAEVATAVAMVAALVAAPAALVAWTACATAPRGNRLRSKPARSPGARPAAP